MRPTSDNIEDITLIMSLFEYEIVIVIRDGHL